MPLKKINNEILDIIKILDIKDKEEITKIIDTYINPGPFYHNIRKIEGNDSKGDPPNCIVNDVLCSGCDKCMSVCLAIGNDNLLEEYEKQPYYHCWLCNKVWPEFCFTKDKIKDLEGCKNSMPCQYYNFPEIAFSFHQQNKNNTIEYMNSIGVLWFALVYYKKQYNKFNISDVLEKLELWSLEGYETEEDRGYGWPEIFSWWIFNLDPIKMIIISCIFNIITKDNII